MCFRIMFLFLFVCWCTLVSYCGAQEVLERTKRITTDTPSDSSKSFGEMLSDFLSSLFSGSKPNSTEVSYVPTDDVSNETEEIVIANKSHSFLDENNTFTDGVQLGVTSENNTTQTGANNTLLLDVLKSSSSSLNASGDVTSTAPQHTDNSKCYYDTHLKYYCAVQGDMSDAEFWDIYRLLFSDALLDALMTNCQRGSWCLQNSDEYGESLLLKKVESVTRSLMNTSVCRPDINLCITNMLNNFVDCSSYSQMQFTLEALQLMCGLTENRFLMPTCYIQVLSALHVSLADILRNDPYDMESDADTCISPEAYMTKNLICVETACPKESKRFHSFGPWTWFTSIQDDIMIECQINSAMCDARVSAQQSTGSNDGTNLQAQEMTSQKVVDSFTTESGTTSPFSSTPYYSSSWTQQSTTSQPEEDRCYTDAVLQNFCAVPDDMTDVSFWDLYSVFFSDTVLDALMIGCSKGSWCLKDRFDYWDSLIVERVDMVMNSEIAESMCNPQVQPCISRVVNSFANCSMFEQMAYTADVLKVICGLRQNTQLTSACYKHVITALHVTLADILREEEKEPVSDDTCESPEAHMTKGLICVENSCPGESETFHSFKPWAWFTKVVNDLIKECNYDSTKCMALLQPPPGYLYGNEMETVVGISAATMVTALTLTIVVCTCYKRHRRNAVVKEGYQRLLTEGDES